MSSAVSGAVVEVEVAVSAPKSRGCAGCWARGYCAAYSLAGPQPPVACPLEGRPGAK